MDVLNQQITIKDVAYAANVHPSTVSRALGGQPEGLVSPATVARVRAVARRPGYEPNALARGLKINRTMTIGMLIPDLTNTIFPPIVRGIEDELGKHGFTLLIANTDNDHDKEADLLGVMARRRVDGLIIATARREYPLLGRMLSANLPVVLVNRTADRPPLSSVAGDDRESIALAVRHLAELGHTRIAHVAATREITTGLIRYQSFLNTMESLGLATDHGFITWCPWFTEEYGAIAFEELLDRGVDFTAVVCANDRVAMGVYDVAAARGLSIADDFSVVGYNDTPFAPRLTPSLTSVRVPYHQIGVKSAELILAAVAEEGDAVPVSIRLGPELVARTSTAPPRADGGRREPTA